jgi:hypothetical protein
MCHWSIPDREESNAVVRFQVDSGDEKKSGRLEDRDVPYRYAR